jgi:hypothetical protein
MTSQPDVDRLVRDLDKAAKSAEKQARGITAKTADRAVTTARGAARAKWTGGEGDSASSIRARMSRRETTVGYVFVDGGGAYQETGTGHHPPNPVLGPAVDAELDRWARDLGTIVDVVVDG